MRTSRTVFLSRVASAVICWLALPGCTALADFPDYPLEVSSVAVGADFICVVTLDHRALCWGNGNNGQLGTDAVFSTDSPVPVEQVGSVSQVAAGQYHACAVDTDHAVWCWGDNELFQVGSDAEWDYFWPNPVITPAPVDRVYVGLYNSCAGTQNGQFFCWGSNRFYQLTELVGTESSAVPVPIELTEPTIESLAVGERHMCALNEGGEVWCWGDNSVGQTGLGQDHADEIPCDGDGRCICTPHWVESLAEVKQISSTMAHTCALGNDGKIKCWGENVSHQVGVDSVSENVYLPAETANGLGVTAWERVFTGFDHSCAIDVDGGLYCWGSNERGQLGIDDETVSKTKTPTRVDGLSGVTDAALGDGTTCAVVGDDGRVYCWGESSHGQITYTVAYYYAPVLIGP